MELSTSNPKTMIRSEAQKKLQALIKQPRDVRDRPLTEELESLIDRIYSELECPLEEIGKIPSRETLRILGEKAEVGRIDGHNQAYKTTDEYFNKLTK